MLLFIRRVSSLLPKARRTPLLFVNNDNHIAALIRRQLYANIDIDIHKNMPFLSKGSTVKVQHADRGPWMYEMIVGHNFDDHNGRNY